MKFKTLLFSNLFLFTYLSYSQTFTGAGGTITNNGVYTYFNLNVSGLSASSMDASFGIEEVCLDITHPDTKELLIFLESPNGTSVELSSLNPGANYTGTCFNSTSSTLISNGTSPYSGAFLAEGFLGDFNNGQAGNGTWKLAIKDWNSFANAGSVNTWSLKFSSTPVDPINFTSSNLPIVVVNTNGQAILDEPKIKVDMGIIYNGDGVRNYLTDAFNHYNGSALIEYRGSSSQQFSKKSMGFETAANDGTKQKVSLLGMPAETDWILYAPYFDKALMRNVLTYNISNLMGQYASRTKYVELVVNGLYRGVYVLMEKVKRDKSRVDISKLTIADNSGDDVTGGYIIKIDKTTGSASGGGFYSKINSSNTTNKVYFQYHYPNPDSITSAQKAYIESYVDSFEAVLLSSNFAHPTEGYRKFIDVNSFINVLIINELSKNVDAYRLSTFLYKDKNSKGGKLKVGPVWDYDLAYANANYDNSTNPSGWRYNAWDNDFPTPVWWKRFFDDPAFVSDLKCRWEELKQNQLSPANLKNYINSDASLLNEAQARNFKQWPVLGSNTWVNPAPYPTTYQEEVDVLTGWIDNRTSWMNSNFTGTCAVGIPELPKVAASIIAYPNPFDNKTTFLFHLNTTSEISLKIYDVLGKEVETLVNGKKPSGSHSVDFDAAALAPGIYYYNLIAGENNVSGKVMLHK